MSLSAARRSIRWTPLQMVFPTSRPGPAAVGLGDRRFGVLGGERKAEQTVRKLKHRGRKHKDCRPKWRDLFPCRWIDRRARFIPRPSWITDQARAAELVTHVHRQSDSGGKGQIPSARECRSGWRSRRATERKRASALPCRRNPSTEAGHEGNGATPPWARRILKRSILKKIGLGARRRR